MAQQTAVECLEVKIKKYGFTIKELVEIFRLLEEAKAIEKKQIIDAANGYTQTEYFGVTIGEHYYNEVYGK